ncbi:phage integrase N-terminal domain-containing protein, partial [Filibacter tadaridae]
SYALFEEGAEKMTKGNSPIMAQMEKVYRHTRANSFATRARYESSCRNFIGFLDEKFKMKNLRNLQDKHVVAYIQQRQAEGIAPKTLKNDLGAIRYMHDMIPNIKHELSDNKELKNAFSIALGKTPAVKGNRAWTDHEYNAMQQFVQDVAESDGRGTETAADVRDVMQLARTMGLRVTEAVAMSRSQVEKALRSGVYQVKGEAKNGKWRQVPLSSLGKHLMESRIQDVQRGGRLFIRPGEQTHAAVNRVEKFMQNNRQQFETAEGREIRMYEGNPNALTYHGLRYNYIQDRVQQEIGKGYSKLQAAAIVTKEVGHERVDVIDVYLGEKGSALL